MPELVTVVCGRCQTPNTVAPRPTVSYAGGEIPTFDPPKCTDCRQLLHPTPDEWATIITAIVPVMEAVPSQWWENYAARHPPTSPTA